MDRVLAATDVPDPSSLPGMGNGLLGLIVTAGLAVAIVLLYRSMRRQMKKIDFNPNGTTDEERMRSDEADGPADSEVNGYHERPPQV